MGVNLGWGPFLTIRSAEGVIRCVYLWFLPCAHIPDCLPCSGDGYCWSGSALEYEAALAPDACTTDRRIQNKQ